MSISEEVHEEVAVAVRDRVKKRRRKSGRVIILFLANTLWLWAWVVVCGWTVCSFGLEDGGGARESLIFWC
jgi:hypothetical protein